MTVEVTFFFHLLTLILASMLLCHLPSCLFTVHEFLSLFGLSLYLVLLFIFIMYLLFIIIYFIQNSLLLKKGSSNFLFKIFLTFKFPLFVAQAIFVSYYTIYYHISSKHASNTSFPWFPNVLFSYLLNDQCKQQDNDSDLICSFPAIREKGSLVTYSLFFQKFSSFQKFFLISLSFL